MKIFPRGGGEIPLSPNWRLDGAGQGVRLLPDAGRGVCDFALVDTAAQQSAGPGGLPVSRLRGDYRGGVYRGAGAGGVAGAPDVLRGG